MKQKNKIKKLKNIKKDKIKLPYKKPELIALGDIRDVTMGGSPGIGDSGGGSPEDFL